MLTRIGHDGRPRPIVLGFKGSLAFIPQFTGLMRTVNLIPSGLLLGRLWAVPGRSTVTDDDSG